MSKKITLLGSTGSIGTQSLDVIRAQGFEVFGANNTKLFLLCLIFYSFTGILTETVVPYPSWLSIRTP